MTQITSHDKMEKTAITTLQVVVSIKSGAVCHT